MATLNFLKGQAHPALGAGIRERKLSGWHPPPALPENR